MRRFSFGVVVVGLVLAAAAGCGTGPGTVDKAKLEKEISRQLAPQLGGTPRAVSCPSDLTAKAGTTMQCTLTANDGSIRQVIITVTSVKGKSLNFDIRMTNPGASPAPSAT